MRLIPCNISIRKISDFHATISKHPCINGCAHFWNGHDVRYARTVLKNWPLFSPTKPKVRYQKFEGHRARFFAIGAQRNRSSSITKMLAHGCDAQSTCQIAHFYPNLNTNGTFSIWYDPMTPDLKPMTDCTVSTPPPSIWENVSAVRVTLTYTTTKDSGPFD